MRRMGFYRGVIAIAALAGAWLPTLSARAETQAVLNVANAGVGSMFMPMVQDNRYSETLLSQSASATYANSTATVMTIIRPQQGIGISATTSDSQTDPFGAQAFADVRSRMVITVTRPGTLIVPLVYQGQILFTDQHYEYNAMGEVMALVEHFDGSSWAPSANSGLNLGARVNRSPMFGDLTDTLGMSASEYTIQSGELAWEAYRSLTATLDEPGIYSVYLGMMANIMANKYDSIAYGYTSYDGYNALRFDGVDFWDCVGGTAGFYDPTNPSLSYNTPEPGTLALLGVSGLWALRRRRRVEA